MRRPHYGKAGSHSALQVVTIAVAVLLSGCSGTPTNGAEATTHSAHEDDGNVAHDAFAQSEAPSPEAETAQPTIRASASEPQLGKLNLTSPSVAKQLDVIMGGDAPPEMCRAAEQQSRNGVTVTRSDESGLQVNPGTAFVGDYLEVCFPLLSPTKPADVTVLLPDGSERVERLQPAEIDNSNSTMYGIQYLVMPESLGALTFVGQQNQLTYVADVNIEQAQERRLLALTAAPQRHETIRFLVVGAEPEDNVQIDVLQIVSQVGQETKVAHIAFFTVAIDPNGYGESSVPWPGADPCYMFKTSDQPSTSAMSICLRGHSL